MFKSCNYCRYRKKKCARKNAWDSRCTECEHLDLVCEFSQRRPSLKRRQTSHRIASGISAAAADSANDLQGAVGRIVSVVKDGDCQLNPTSVVQQPGLKAIFKDETPNLQRTKEKYWELVFPLTPFLPPEMVFDDDEDWNPILRRGIDQLASIWLHPRTDPSVAQQSNDFLNEFSEIEMTRECLACVLLMMLRLPVRNDDIQRVFANIHVALVIGEELPTPVLAGAVVANTWLRLVGSSLAPLDIPDGFLMSFTEHLDRSTFAYHYLRISNLALTFEKLRFAMEREGLGPDAKTAWSRLEYECLFWAVHLPSTLLDLRDEMPARPEAVIIHSHHNLVLLSFYATVIENQDTLGKLLALRPMPGVLHYICSLIRSVFICPSEMIPHWVLLSDIQAATARIALQLWRQTKFENFCGLLNLWDDTLERFPKLTQEVREEIGTGPWTIDQTDGYSVFWTFRDLRSLHLEYAVPQLAAEAVSCLISSTKSATSPSIDTSPQAS